MFRLKIVLLFTGIIMMGLFNAPIWGQQSSQIDKWGVGVFAGYNRPLFNFYDRFDGGPKFGLKLSFVKNNTTYDVAFFTSKYSSGKIEQAEFQWNYDGNYYSSPDASSEMEFLGMTVGIEKLFRDARAMLIEDGSNDTLAIVGGHKIIETYPRLD